MADPIIIRECQLNDIDSLSSLMNQLGYPTTADEMFKRLIEIGKKQEYTCLIAEQNQQMAGMIGFHQAWSYHDNGCHVRINALVTDGNHRGKGIAALLIRQAEQCAIRMKAQYLLVNCGNREERMNAHRFYQHHGFVPRTTGYAKKLI